MAKRRDYIPSKLHEFLTYQEFLFKQVSKQAKAWGIPKAEVEEFARRKTEYEAAQKQASNEILRSRADAMRHTEQRADYTRYIRSVVQGYLAHSPAVTANERFVMGLTVKTERRRKLNPIKDDVHCFLKALGGCMVRFSCSLPKSLGRPKLHPECHAVEVEYMLLDSREIPDRRPFAGTDRHTSSRAQFKLCLGRPGQYLHVRARWVNTSDPSRSGGWGDIRIVMIH